MTDPNTILQLLLLFIIMFHTCARLILMNILIVSTSVEGLHNCLVRCDVF